MHGKIFYYMHDLHFIRDRKEYEITNDADKLASSIRWKETEYNLFSHADVVLTPSIQEKEIIRADFPEKSIRVMPAFFYPSIPDPIRNFNERKDILFVGGFGHSPNLDAILWFIEEGLSFDPKKGTKKIRLIIVGSLMPEKVTKLASDHILVKGFVPDADLENIYGSVRLAVIPLRYGAGVEGLKRSRRGACQEPMPLVSPTSFGIEGLNDTGHFLKPQDTADAFAAALIDLYMDPVRLREFSVSAVAYDREHVSLKLSARIFFQNLFLNVAYAPPIHIPASVSSVLYCWH